MHPQRYQGVFPVVPTTFREDGSLDLASQKRCLDFMIDADGTLLEQRRGEHAPHSTDAGASALTSVGSTLYWTSAGLPHRS